MFKITYEKTGKEIKLTNKTMWLRLDHSQLVELGFESNDLWDKE